MKNVISVDLEDWASRTIVKKANPSLMRTDSKHDYLVNSTREVLKLYSQFRQTGTFFVVGEDAYAAPEILEMISSYGHEIAIHSWRHETLAATGPKRFSAEVQRARNFVWVRTNSRPIGYRAPEFSMLRSTKWALPILQDQGFVYDSSVVPGVRPVSSFTDFAQLPFGAPYWPYRPAHDDPARVSSRSEERIIEFPMATRRIFRVGLPLGGGIYLRTLGVSPLLGCVKWLNKRGHPAMIYVHNWEIVGFPKIKMPSVYSWFSYFRLPNHAAFRTLLRWIRSTTARDLMGEFG